MHVFACKSYCYVKILKKAIPNCLSRTCYSTDCDRSIDQLVIYMHTYMQFMCNVMNVFIGVTPVRGARKCWRRGRPGAAAVRPSARIPPPNGWGYFKKQSKKNWKKTNFTQKLVNHLWFDDVFSLLFTGLWWRRRFSRATLRAVSDWYFFFCFLLLSFYFADWPIEEGPRIALCVFYRHGPGAELWTWRHIAYDYLSATARRWGLGFIIFHSYFAFLLYFDFLQTKM